MKVVLKNSFPREGDFPLRKGAKVPSANWFDNPPRNPTPSGVGLRGAAKFNRWGLLFYLLSLFSLPVSVWAAFQYEPAIVCLRGRVLETTAPEFMIEDEGEKNLRLLEEQIPALAVAAVEQAYWRALASGYSVLVAKGDALIEIHPDGTETFIKSLPPLIPVTQGQRIEIDSAFPITILALDEPIDVGSEEDLEHVAETDVCEIQLVFPHHCPPPNSLCKNIIIKGSLFPNYAPQHKRRVIMVVASWENEGDRANRKF